MYTEIDLSLRTDLNKNEIIDGVNKYHGILDGIILPIHLVHEVRGKLEPSFLVSTKIPIGLPQNRITSAKTAINQGCNALDVPVNLPLLASEDYATFYQDLQNFAKFGRKKEITVRYLLEYRHFQWAFLEVACKVLQELGEKYVAPSTGQFVDDLESNVIFGKRIESHNLSYIYTGNMWSSAQLNKVKSCNPYGIRLFSSRILEYILTGQESFVGNK